VARRVAFSDIRLSLCYPKPLRAISGVGAQKLANQARRQLKSASLIKLGGQTRHPDPPQKGAEKNQKARRPHKNHKTLG
jgi:hypothetical protein